MLAPYLTRDNADDLVAVATRKTKIEIELLIAERFPRLDLATQIKPISPWTPQLAPGPVEATPPRPKLTPLSPERFGLQVTIDRSTYDTLLLAKALLSHAMPSGNVVEVLDRALDVLTSSSSCACSRRRTSPAPVDCSRLPRSADHNGMFPCFFHGSVWRLLRSISSAAISRGRVSRGSMTSSR